MYHIKFLSKFKIVYDHFFSFLLKAKLFREQLVQIAFEKLDEDIDIEIHKHHKFEKNKK